MEEVIVSYSQVGQTLVVLQVLMERRPIMVNCSPERSEILSPFSCTL